MFKALFEVFKNVKKTPSSQSTGRQDRQLQATPQFDHLTEITDNLDRRLHRKERKEETYLERKQTQHQTKKTPLHSHQSRFNKDKKESDREHDRDRELYPEEEKKRYNTLQDDPHTPYYSKRSLKYIKGLPIRSQEEKDEGKREVEQFKEKHNETAHFYEDSNSEPIWLGDHSNFKPTLFKIIRVIQQNQGTENVNKSKVLSPGVVKPSPIRVTEEDNTSVLNFSFN